jgi:hypothetical protein
MKFHEYEVWLPQELADVLEHLVSSDDVPFTSVEELIVAGAHMLVAQEQERLDVSLN